MVEMLIKLIIICLICGFIYWVWLKLSPLLPIADPFKSIINVLVLIIIGAIVLFYILIPILEKLPAPDP